MHPIGMVHIITIPPPAFASFRNPLDFSMVWKLFFHTMENVETAWRHASCYSFVHDTGMAVCINAGKDR